MLAVQSYDLLFAGAGEHLLSGLTKASISEKHGIAEYFLDKMGYANYPNVISNVMLNNSNASLKRKTADYLERVHHDHQTDIESKWQQPRMTDSEAEELFYRELLDDRITDLVKDIDIELRL